MEKFKHKVRAIKLYQIIAKLVNSLLTKSSQSLLVNGSFSNLVAKTFKVITRKKVFIPGKFANANQQACVKCALR